MIDESDKKANYLLRFCQPITDTISFIFKYIDPTDEEELINCACSTGKNLSLSEPTLPSRPNPDRFIFSFIDGPSVGRRRVSKSFRKCKLGKNQRSFGTCHKTKPKITFEIDTKRNPSSYMLRTAFEIYPFLIQIGT